jgi:hypothetical protein
MKPEPQRRRSGGITGFGSFNPEKSALAGRRARTAIAARGAIFLIVCMKSVDPTPENAPEAVLSPSTAIENAAMPIQKHKWCTFSCLKTGFEKLLGYAPSRYGPSRRTG